VVVVEAGYRHPNRNVLLHTLAPSTKLESGDALCHKNIGLAIPIRVGDDANDDNDAAAYGFALFIRASGVYERFEVWNQRALVHAYSREMP